MSSLLLLHTWNLASTVLFQQATATSTEFGKAAIVTLADRGRVLHQPCGELHSLISLLPPCTILWGKKKKIKKWWSSTSIKSKTQHKLCSFLNPQIFKLLVRYTRKSTWEMKKLPCWAWQSYCIDIIPPSGSKVQILSSWKKIPIQLSFFAPLFTGFLSYTFRNWLTLQFSFPCSGNT